MTSPNLQHPIDNDADFYVALFETTLYDEQPGVTNDGLFPKPNRIIVQV